VITPVCRLVWPPGGSAWFSTGLQSDYGTGDEKGLNEVRIFGKAKCDRTSGVKNWYRKRSRSKRFSFQENITYDIGLIARSRRSRVSNRTPVRPRTGSPYDIGLNGIAAVRRVSNVNIRDLVWIHLIFSVGEPMLSAQAEFDFVLCWRFDIQSKQMMSAVKPITNDTGPSRRLSQKHNESHRFFSSRYFDSAPPWSKSALAKVRSIKPLRLPSGSGVQLWSNRV
jgi:hypothetical protein